MTSWQWIMLVVHRNQIILSIGTQLICSFKANPCHFVNGRHFLEWIMFIHFALDWYGYGCCTVTVDSIRLDAGKISVQTGNANVARPSTLNTELEDASQRFAVIGSSLCPSFKSRLYQLSTFFNRWRWCTWPPCSKSYQFLFTMLSNYLFFCHVIMIMYLIISFLIK